MPHERQRPWLDPEQVTQFLRQGRQLPVEVPDVDSENPVAHTVQTLLEEQVTQFLGHPATQTLVVVFR